MFKAFDGLSHLLLFLLSTEEDKLGVSLSCSTLGLNKALHIQDFIYADNEIASGNIKTFLNHRGCDQYVNLVVFEVFNVLHKVLMTHLNVRKLRKEVLKLANLFLNAFSRPISFVS